MFRHSFRRAFGFGLDFCCAQLYYSFSIADVVGFAVYAEFSNLFSGFLTCIQINKLTHLFKAYHFKN
jgi:hypothetical protein